VLLTLLCLLLLLLLVLLQRVRAALTRLGLSSLPLLQLHWEDFRAKGYLDVARHLMDMKERGLVQHFWVANWDMPRLVQGKDQGITLVSSQVLIIPVSNQVVIIPMTKQVVVIPVSSQVGLTPVSSQV
jgi:diketogulonate reductase-like aldo/keto reductase